MKTISISEIRRKSEVTLQISCEYLFDSHSLQTQV